MLRSVVLGGMGVGSRGTDTVSTCSLKISAKVGGVVGMQQEAGAGVEVGAGMGIVIREESRKVVPQVLFFAVRALR